MYYSHTWMVFSIQKDIFVLSCEIYIFCLHAREQYSSLIARSILVVSDHTVTWLIEKTKIGPDNIETHEYLQKPDLRAAGR